MNEHAPDDAALPPRLPWYHRAPVLTMALNLALIMTIFLTRERWEPWVAERRWPLSDRRHRVYVSPNHKWAILFGESHAALLDVESGTSVRVIEGDVLRPGRVTFHADGDLATIVWNRGSSAPPLRCVSHGVASGDSHIQQSTPFLVIATEGRRAVPLAGHKGHASHTSFSQDGTRLLTMSWGDKTARVRDAATGKELLVLGEHDGHFRPPCLSPDGGRVLTSGRDGTARVYDVATGALVLEVREGDEPLGDVRFSPDGKNILIASPDGTVRILNSHTGAPVTVLKGHSGRLFLVKFCVAGRRVVTRSCSDKTWRIWDAGSGEELKRISPDAFLVFSPDDKRVAAVPLKRSGPLKVFDLETGLEIASFQMKKVVNVSVPFSPDGRRILVRDDNTVKLLDIETGAGLSFPPFEDQSRRKRNWSAKFTPDGTRIVTWRAQESASIWDVETGELLAKTPEAWSCAVLDDNTLLLESPPTKDLRSSSFICRRIRSERWWGVFFLPHLYLIIALALAVAWSGWRDVKRLRRMS
jgi:WD40 repeat protein